MDRLLVVAAVALVSGGCMIASSRSEANSSASATVIIRGSAALSPSVAVIVLRCDPDKGALFELSGELVASAASRVEVSASACGAGHQLLGVVEPTAFERSGDAEERASYELPLRLARSGMHAVVLCFTRLAEGGASGEFVCSQEFDLDSACPTEPTEPAPGVSEHGETTTSVPLGGEKSCETENAFGELVGNPSLCTGAGELHVPIQVRGGFGEAPQLSITGPNGYLHQAELRHSGESCNYQYSWSTAGHGGPGEYAFAVAGEGRSLAFTAPLGCGGP